MYEGATIHIWKDDKDKYKAQIPDNTLPVLDDYDQTEVVGEASNFQKTEEGITADIELDEEARKKAEEVDVSVTSGWMGNFETDENVKLVTTGIVPKTSRIPEPSLSEQNGQD